MASGGAPAALIEIGGGTIAGPAIPFIIGHAGMVIALGGLLVLSGVGIIGAGVAMIYRGATGKNP